MIECNTETRLDAGLLPVEDLAKIGRREGFSPRPVYQAHRWFARRFGSAFRALLVAAACTKDDDFWDNYYDGVSWRNKTVLDPFVGGGTSIVEALRFGADVVGVDVDAVACAVTRFETRLNGLPDLSPALGQLKETVGERLARYYRTLAPCGEYREVLHYFWVQLVDCENCGMTVEAHPHFRLAYEAQGSRQWVFCPTCHSVQELDKSEKETSCTACGFKTTILDGPVSYGKLTCPHCGETERLIEIASRTGTSPRWHLFALETLEPPLDMRVIPMEQRQFRPATSHDQEVFRSAQEALRIRMDDKAMAKTLPTASIPRDRRADDRILKYGYERYLELFNARQQLHLSCLVEEVDKLPESAREGFAIAFSNHLATNCMMTHYAFGWRRLAPLFSIRAYRHITRPVEINPWLDGTGRGTYPNAVRQVQRAIDWMHSPKEPLPAGGFRPVEEVDEEETEPEATVVQADSRTLGFVSDNIVDFVLTDPPYFDNIAYSELSDFYLPWLQLLKVVESNGEGHLGIRRNLAAKARDADALEGFQNSLRECFSEIARVLKPTGRLVFTYQHHTAGAWYALAQAIASSRLRPIQLIPLLGDSSQGPAKSAGNIRWDAVFVFGKRPENQTRTSLLLTDKELEAGDRHYLQWARRLVALRKIEFRDADRCNFYRACLVVAALGMFSREELSCSVPETRALKDLLDREPPQR